MKTIRTLLYVFVGLHLGITTTYSRYDHICCDSNDSVVKFRKKTFGASESLDDALKLCLAEKIVGKNTVLFEWPIDLCDFWVSSLFGPRCHNGVTRMHKGIDMAATTGVQVKAAAAGVVQRAEMGVTGYGSVVEIKHAHGFVTRYGHLQKIFMQVGQKVDLGDAIGLVGASGNVRGTKDPSHLHFEIIKSGQHVNPLKYLYCSEVAFVGK